LKKNQEKPVNNNYNENVGVRTVHWRSTELGFDAKDREEERKVKLSKEDKKGANGVVRTLVLSCGQSLTTATFR